MKLQQLHTQSPESQATAQHHEPSMALVPAGEFTMGSATGDADERPVHQVYVEAFFMDKYQVSVGQYARFLEATSQDAPPEWSLMNRPQHQTRPVVNVDWADAAALLHMGRQTPADRGGVGEGGAGDGWPHSIPGGMSLRRGSLAN